MANPKVLVIGGGIGGMTAALVLARFGAEVDIVERNRRLGGHAAEFACKALDACVKCGACLVAETLEAAATHPRISAHTDSRLEAITGGDRFTYTIRNTSGTSIRGDADAVVIAAGFRTFDPSTKPYGYGRFPNMITNLDLERMLRANAKAIRPSDGERSQAHGVHPVRRQPGCQARPPVVLPVLLRGGLESGPADPTPPTGRPTSRFFSSTSRPSAETSNPSTGSLNASSGSFAPFRGMPSSWKTPVSGSPTWTIPPGKAGRRSSISLCSRPAWCRRRDWRKRPTIWGWRWQLSGYVGAQAHRGVFAAGAVRGPMRIAETIADARHTACQVLAFLGIKGGIPEPLVAERRPLVSRLVAPGRG